MTSCSDFFYFLARIVLRNEANLKLQIYLSLSGPTWKDFAILLSGNIAVKTWLIFEVELLLKPEHTDFNDQAISAFCLAKSCIVKSTI